MNVRKFFLLLVAACGGASQVAPRIGEHEPVPVDQIDHPSPPVTPEELVAGFRITNYTLASELDLSGQRSGNRTRVTAHGLPGDYAWEFLCSSRGVAMQGTGVTAKGQLVHYVSGGGGFCGKDRHLCNCEGAKWTLASGVFGASGRPLVENFSIAVDPTVIPYGSFVWIDSMKRWFRADDTGGAIIGKHIDVYVGTQPFVFNGETAIYVTSEPRTPDDPGPPGADASCARDGLVCGDVPRMLYRCHDGRLTFERACAGGCRKGNGNDSCNPRPSMQYCSAAGWYCGGDRVDGRPDALYHCVDHGLVLETTCAMGCSVDPDRIADACF